MTADIHSFESLAAVDGDGIRFAVFFTGCPLRCVCCHNPDTWAASGRKMESRALCEKIKRFKTYFSGGGGVTFSGGEPLLNAKYINELGGMLKEGGINYALDTSGAVVPGDDVKTAVNNAELVILDVKYPDADMYSRYTGGDFGVFLRFADYVSRAGVRVWYRTVIIPGINDGEDMPERYTRLVSRWRKPEKYELLPFHTMGFAKYAELGLRNPLENTKPLEENRLEELQARLDGCLNHVFR